MKMRTLGRTGIRISPYCLGTMMFGHVGGVDQDAATRIVDRALEAGINVVDTADVYAGGESEEILGHALKGRRDDVVLTTKVNGPMPAGPGRRDPNRGGSSRRWIAAEVEQSLRRLQTDHIDVYLLHHPDPLTDVEETLSALTDLVRSGKVRTIGSSNLPASDIVDAQWAAQRRGFERLRVEEPTYSILNRGIEREVLPVCQRHGLGTLVWSPLSMGMLTGRYRKGQGQHPGHAARMRWVPRHLTDEPTLDAVEQLIALAAEAGMSLTHLAMAFAVAHPGVTSAIIGPRTIDHLDDLLAGADTVLDDDLLDRIDAIVAPGTDLGRLDVAYTPPAVELPALRRRPAPDRVAA